MTDEIIQSDWELLREHLIPIIPQAVKEAWEALYGPVPPDEDAQ